MTPRKTTGASDGLDPSLSNDEVRRRLRNVDAEQAAAMADARSVLSAVLHGDAQVDAGAKADALLGGLARRRFLRLGGLSVAAAAVVAACGGDTVAPSKNVPVAGEAPPTTGLPERTIDDTVLLRTASSLEHNAVDAYGTLLATGALTGALADAVKLFQDHHRQHASAAEDATRAFGGTPYTSANPVVKANIVDPAIALINQGGNKPADILWFAYGLESVAAGTYQTMAPILTQQNLRQAAARVASVESRHIVVIAAALKAPVAPASPSNAPASTSSSAGSTTTNPNAVEIPTIYQVPAAFSPLTPTDIVIHDQKLTVDILGPNSYMYNPGKGA
jgi:hypothetical protein